MKELKVVAFDCDGVMFDSRNANKKYYNFLMSRFDLPKMTEEQTIFAHSHTVNETMDYLTKGTRLFEIIERYRQQLSYKKFINLMKIEPTLLSVLEKLRFKLKTAVATNRTDTINQILEHYEIDHLFDFVISSSEVEDPKPNPAILKKLIEHFNVEPDEVVYIGDSKLDELASIAANVTFVAFKNKTLRAFAHIDSLSKIEDVLLEYSTLHNS